MKYRLAGLLLIGATMMGCGLGEECENEAGMVSLNIGDVRLMIDAYEASRTNATSETFGTGVTMACNYRNSLPWNNVTYEDALNACLDAGKRLCTKEEWQAACANTNGASCNANGIQVVATGSMSGCRSQAGAYDMAGNLAEWVEGGYLMGGGFNNQSSELSCSKMDNHGVNNSYATQTTGFRCCQDVSTL